MPWGAIAGSGWASGLNLYATVFLVGLAGRLDWATTPTQLQSTPVLIVAGVLYSIEFFVDKIPFVDSASDAIHTVIRPLGAAWLAAVMAGDTSWMHRPIAALAAGALALTSHGAKATTRAAANMSPEPFSNIALSLGEDGIVGAMVALALLRPRIAAVVAALLAAVCLVVIWKLARFIRRIFGRTLGRKTAKTF
jgi:energy-converting hydrogenase Eha subunit C